MWRSIITSLYPDALSRTYRVPPEHFNKVPYSRVTVAGTRQSALLLPVPLAAPVHNAPPVSEPSGSAAPVVSSQPSGSAAPVVSSQPSGSAAPVVSSQPSGSAAPVVSSQPAGSATPAQNVPSASQQSNPLTQYSLWTQEPQSPAMPVRVQESDYRDDFCQFVTMKHLEELGKAGHEVMFIVSQLNFGSYLNKPSYAAAVAQLPRPINLAPSYRQGDFDVLVIHRHYGILIGEIKAVGMNHADLNMSQLQADADVAKKVGQAVKQLDKSQTVVKHLVSDNAPGLTVRKTLFLPFVSSTQLQRVLSANPQLKQEVCRSLGAGNTADAVQLCCCADQLSDPATYWDVTPAVLSKLTTWWQHRMACVVDTIMTDDLYLDIVARFVGPATSVDVHCSVPPRVEVRTVGEAVAELGRRLACLVLIPQQLDLMQRSPPLVYLTGPPGTGKTIMLVLQGLKWARQGHDVDVVSLHPDSRAANVMIQHQLQMTLSADPTTSPTPGTVRLHQYNFDDESDVYRVVSDLLSGVRHGTLCVLMDEAGKGGGFPGLHRPHPGLQRLVRQLTGRVTHLYLWCASVGHIDIPPELQTEILTTPLRCAPAVLREVGPVVAAWSETIHPYTDSGLPAPGDGPSVVRLSHHGDTHTGPHPTDCEECGRDVADQLRRLGVGSGGRYVTNSPASLAYRDVFVLTDDDYLHDEARNDAGNMTSPASGVVVALRHAQIPVCVLEYRDRAGDVTGWESRVADVAVSRTDEVTVAHWRSVQGLERRVVVWMTDWLRDVVDVVIPYRMPAISRCTTQLIIVNPPPVDSDTETSDSTHHSHTSSEDNAADEDQTTT